MFSDNETDNNDVDIRWGSNVQATPIAGQSFSSAIDAEVVNGGVNPWDAGLFNKSQISIEEGDLIFCTFYARTLTGPGKVSLVIEHETTFAKEFFFESNIPTEWTQYFIKFESEDDYDIGELNFGFQYGTAAQNVQFGGFTAINFSDNATFDQLPIDINNDKYGGYEANAPWRAEAAQRIQDLRTVELTIDAKDQNGNPIQNGLIEVRMKEHNFKFGSAVNACQFANNSCHIDMYNDRIEDLDGEGHSFNMIVFENDTKWPTWENEYALSQRSEIVTAVDWLNERSIEVRGHTLVWPGNSVLPDDVAASNSIDYIKGRINGHIEEILNYPGLKDKIIEWDVLNEIATNRDLENKFIGSPGYQTGRELYKEIFDKVKAEDPNTKLVLNDFVTLSTNDNPTAPNYMNLVQFLEELLDAGAPVEAIGFQGHIGGFPNSIYDVETTLDDFYDSYGLPAKITEFDLPDVVSEQLAADYLRDFMTMIYSHPSMEGFLFWSFWDGATYKNPGANLFRQDWSRTPAGDTFLDLLFNQWWTEEDLQIANGLASTNAYKGTYEISYMCDGIFVEEEVVLLENTTLNIVCDNLTTSVPDNFLKRVSLFPNPSSGLVDVERNATKLSTLQVHDLSGTLILSQEVVGQNTSFSVPNPGVYMVTIDGHTQRLVVR
jgi:GH35 family endo-1,4-beta-xylanase